MKQAIAPWFYPLLLALLGLILFVGNFTITWRAAVGGESILFLGYLFLRQRLPVRHEHIVSNVVSLFPGHLLLLFAVGILSPPSSLLIVLWMLIPVMSILYDLASGISQLRLRVSILAGLYCIIWADLFFILERVISLGRKLSREEELIVAAVFGVVGVSFLWIGAYRHLRLSNLDKE